jgi:hypothetical protein
LKKEELKKAREEAQESRVPFTKESFLQRLIEFIIADDQVGIFPPTLYSSQS